jgi:hypothetical protein
MMYRFYICKLRGFGKSVKYFIVNNLNQIYGIHFAKERCYATTALVTGGICSCPSLLMADDRFNQPAAILRKFLPNCYSISKNSISIDLNKADLLNVFGDAATIVNDERGVHIIIVKSFEREYVAFEQNLHTWRQCGKL